MHVQNVQELSQQEWGGSNREGINVLKTLMNDACCALEDVKAEMLKSPWVGEDKLAGLKRAMNTITASAKDTRELIKWYKSKDKVMRVYHAAGFTTLREAIRQGLLMGLQELSAQTGVSNLHLAQMLIEVKHKVATTEVEITQDVRDMQKVLQGQDMPSLVASAVQHEFVKVFGHAPTANELEELRRAHAQEKDTKEALHIQQIIEALTLSTPQPEEIAGSGYTFEREEIERCLTIKHKCPITGRAVISPLKPNVDLREAIQKWLSGSPAAGSSHASPATFGFKYQPSSTHEPHAIINTTPGPSLIGRPPATVVIDLAALQALLQAEGPAPPNIDLQGRTVTGQLPPGQQLTIRQPGTLLADGKLVLPPGVGIFVRVHAKQTQPVMLKDLTVSGQGSADRGLVDIQGIAAVKDCTITVGGDGQDTCHGLAVHSGGSARIVQSTVSSATGHGFVSDDSGSQLTVQGCTAAGNRCCGFAAKSGGVLLAEDACTASNNMQHGFYASGTGSEVTTGDGCSAINNGRSGFRANSGGAITAGANSLAHSNKAYGFRAEGTDSKVITGDGCRATSNGASGFYANGGGNLTVGAKCSAKDNKRDGFAATGLGSRLITGDGCSATRNGWAGFSCDGGKLTAGADCSAHDNKLHGFCIWLGGALVVGARAKAEGNPSGNFSNSIFSSIKRLQGHGH